MTDTLESGYTEMLCHINEAMWDVNDPRNYTMDGVPIRKLFVSNLAERTTYKDLRKRFLVYGDVESCYLRRERGKNAYAFVTFTTVSDAVVALRCGGEKEIRLHSRDLRVACADSWNQPDSIENKSYNATKEQKKTCGITERYPPQCHEQNDTQNVSINMLNDDCLRHIFWFLPIADRIRIERVCKRWRILSQDSWHTTRTLDLSTLTWGFVSSYAIHTAKIRRLLLKCGQFLTRIDLSNPNHCLSRSTLTIIAKFCPNLISVDISALTACMSGIDALTKNCNKIRRFCLGPSTHSCDNRLKNLFVRNKDLEYVAITKNSFLGKSLSSLSEQIMHTLILQKCDYIQDIHVSLALKKLQNLKHLVVRDCIGIAERTLKVLGECCKNLKELELAGDFPSTQKSKFLYLTRLVSLHTLKITYNIKISDEFLVSLAQRCQQLVYVDITACRNVTDNGLTAIGMLVKLENLIINYLDCITDSGLQNISGLKEFECRYCPFITDHGVSNIIKRSPQLRLLDLSRCKAVTFSTLQVAKDSCNNRSDNVMLKLIIGGTSIYLENETNDDKPSPLLQIVNVDLTSRRISLAMDYDDEYYTNYNVYNNENDDYDYDNDDDRDDYFYYDYGDDDPEPEYWIGGDLFT